MSVEARFQKRRDSAAAWTTANPVLLPGEVGWEIDTRRQKTGDGATAWAALAYDDVRLIAAPANPTDGQALVWSAAQSAWVPVTATGITVAGSAINTTNTQTTCTAGAGNQDIPGTTFAFAPNGSKELWLAASCAFQPTVSGNGVVGLTIQEISNGVDATVSWSALMPTASQTIGVSVLVPLARLGVPARTRTFKLQAVAATTSAVVLNNVVYPSTLRGEWH